MVITDSHRATIRDVAREAHVSTATISRVMNNSPLVKEETKRHVMQVVRELDYEPNIIARGLVVRKTHTLGLIVSPATHLFSAYYFTEVLRGVESASNIHGYGLLLNVPRMEQTRISYAHLYEQSKADGVIILAPPSDDEGIKRLVERKTPAVLIGGFVEGLSSVRVNNVDSAFSVVEHLISLGHRRIAMVNGIMSGIDAQERFRGYQLALAKHGIEMDDGLVGYGEYDQEKGFEVTMKLFSNRPQPTAMFCANDLMALGAVKAIREYGYDCPEDVSVVGFDDMEAAAYFHPPLTTVRQPLFDIGREATTILINQIEKKVTEPQTVILKSELIIRGSTAKLKENDER